MAQTNGEIKNYAGRLKEALSMPLGLVLDEGHYTPLNLKYSRTLFADAYGHRHTFVIREGSGLSDRLFGQKILKGVYYEKRVLGAGSRHIEVYDPENYDMIVSAVRAVNEEFDLDFVVREIERERRVFPAVEALGGVHTAL